MLTVNDDQDFPKGGKLTAIYDIDNDKMETFKGPTIEIKSADGGTGNPPDPYP